MSHKNPNYKEVLANSTGVIGQHYGKSYHQLARYAFSKLYKRKPTLDDSQTIRDIFEAEWMDWYVTRPKAKKEERIKSRPIWLFGCSIHIDVEKSMFYFLRDIIKVDSSLIYDHNYGTYIMDNGLFDEWKEYVLVNKKDLVYHKKRYIDYSELAYNGVTDDF